ncbi:MAG TPA: preprotein translocase subunit SecG [Candidatus Paceibacterota bacterium]|nr:preprotein translocase subunit SecG [Candidatus Paceibacterota bacterium]
MQLANLLPYIQIGLAVILTALILVQQSEGSLGAAFGGDSFGANPHTRRGAELYIFRTTIVVAVLFVLSALAHLFV